MRPLNEFAPMATKIEVTCACGRIEVIPLAVDVSCVEVECVCLREILVRFAAGC
jgi:hypothetical protein